MNPGVFSVQHNRVVLVAMALAVIGGLVAYRNLGRLEDRLDDVLGENDPFRDPVQRLYPPCLDP